MPRKFLILFVLTIGLYSCGTPPTTVPAPIMSPPTVESQAVRTLPSPIPSATAPQSANPILTPTHSPGLTPTLPRVTPTALPLNPLQIAYLRKRSYPGSAITIEQTLAPGANYNQYIASYQSDGLKIYALLTVPRGPKPPTGWPVIIFNHGYIPPHIYQTTQRYVAYVDALARAGYIVFKSDYRGHGRSQGSADGGGYWSPDFTIDVLNALSSLQKFPEADPHRIGMWGHSMGGMVTLRAAVVSKAIKAEVIWSGVVGTYEDLMYNWHQTDPTDYVPTAASQQLHETLIKDHGTPRQDAQFWASVSPSTYIGDLSGPLQLHHDLADGEVPVEFSQELYAKAKQAGKIAELYTYPGDDHNLTHSFSLAMQRTIAFFDQYVKR